mgnify:CR=1 FL=1
MEAKVKAKLLSLLKIVNIPKSYILEKLDKMTSFQPSVLVQDLQLNSGIHTFLIFQSHFDKKFHPKLQKTLCCIKFLISNWYSPVFVVSKLIVTWRWAWKHWVSKKLCSINLAQSYLTVIKFSIHNLWTVVDIQRSL